MEKERADFCFHQDTWKRMEKKIKEKMIIAYSHQIIEKEGSGVRVMLQDWNIKDLKLTFDVFQGISASLDEYIGLIKEFFKFSFFFFKI